MKLLTRLVRADVGPHHCSTASTSRDWEPAALRRRIGGDLPGLRALPAQGRREHRRRATSTHFEDEARWREAAELAMAAPFVEELPGGLRRRSSASGSRTAASCSGGQWQKIALSRAFMREGADILVLDEPTAAMDARAEAQVFEQFRELAARAHGDPDLAPLLDGAHGRPDRS
ncbi:MAG: ATP-binding cassette domain-containing protein [Comamonadaceae bacterium]|nr:ATP-binding cassette domain-containing protein [Comamonadaceae bacterium]